MIIFQVDAVLSMIASLICDQSDQPLVDPDPEDLAEEQGLLARQDYIFISSKVMLNKGLFTNCKFIKWC